MSTISRGRLVFFVATIQFLFLSSLCQEKAISVDETRQIIDTCIAAFKTYYIYPDVVQEMEQMVKKKYYEGGYDSISDLPGLTMQIRKDFRLVSHDRHIWIDVMENLPMKDSDISEQDKMESLKKGNFGFNKVEILPGNIAYLKLDAFTDLKYGKDTAFSIMNRLTCCDAMIIDLRDNHGGHENMVQFIASYFFEEKKQLNSLYFRFADSLVSGWTDPDVAEKRMIHQKLFILTGERTASAAESFTCAMKNYHRAVIIGQPTRGAAHWTETYTMPGLGIFLEIPVARPINPVTGKDWEGTGVLPDILVPEYEAPGQALMLAGEH